MDGANDNFGTPLLSTTWSRPVLDRLQKLEWYSTVPVNCQGLLSRSTAAENEADGYALRRPVIRLCNAARAGLISSTLSITP